jgi:uncharacterized protein YegP (UPF0339 family)
MSRFEIVRSDAGWFGRHIASNGREVWRTSEVYTRRRGVLRAVELITGYTPYHVLGDWWITTPKGVREIRDVDERGPS